MDETLMGFSSQVAEKALLDCGRCCCICHKFCGPKIETHHIVQPRDGGKDTFENCIPLCLDCHAEVKAYNPKHPKGRKYTESELIGHRDRWYKKVADSHALSSNPNYIELDKKLFVELREILTRNWSSIDYLRDHDYGGSFMYEWHKGLKDFLHYCEQPEYEFFDADLEAMKTRLADSIMKFLDVIANNTFPLEGNSEYGRIYEDPEMDSHFVAWCHHNGISDEEFKERVKRGREFISQIKEELNTLSLKAWETYEDFVRLARRKLGIHISHTNQQES